MTTNEFNEKYKDFLAERHYGLALFKPEAIAYLDEKFQEFIQRPDFKYYQIKSEWNWFSFFADGITREEQQEVEAKLKEIHNGQ